MCLVDDVAAANVAAAAVTVAVSKWRHQLCLSFIQHQLRGLNEVCQDADFRHRSLTPSLSSLSLSSLSLFSPLSPPSLPLSSFTKHTALAKECQYEERECVGGFSCP